MSAPAYGTSGAWTSANATTIAYAVPASVAAGDIIVIPMFIDGSTRTITAMPTGFAHAPNSPRTVAAGNGGNHSINVVWKRATAADTGTYSFTISATGYLEGQAHRYTSCVASGAVWDVTTSAESGITGVATSPAVSVTTTGPDEMLFFAATNWGGGAWTPPGGFNERTDNSSDVTADDKVQAAAGGSGTVQATCAVTDKSGAWLGALIGTTVAGGVPWNPQRTTPTSDPGKTWWQQQPRLDANTVATVTDPLGLAAGVGGDTWRRQVVAAFGDRRQVPQQRTLVNAPQPYRANTAEGAPSSGTTVTTGNSGGASGDPWSAITIGTSGTLTFDSSQTAHGGYAYSLSTGGTSALVTASWTGLGSNPTLWWRSYLRLSAANAGQAVVRFRASGAQVHRITVTAAGKLVIRDSANTIVATSTTTVAANTWYRVEGYCTVGAAGTAELKIWTSIDDPGSPVETLTAAAQNYGTTNIDEAMWGIVGATANVNQYWLDDLAVSDTGYLGPSGTSSDPLLGAVDDLRRHIGYGPSYQPQWTPRQRTYVSDPLLLSPFLLENELLGSASDLTRHRHAAVYTDRRLVPQQHVYVSDPNLLGTAELEDELLGWADTGRRYATPATHSPRWWAPQQPKRDGTAPGLLDGAQLENELLGSVDDLGRHRHAAVYTDRRLAPQQRLYLSVVGLLDAALLENELLGGAGAAQRTNVPVTHAPRWWMPQQPARQTWWFDAGPDVPPLTLAWGAGGMYDLLYLAAGWQPSRREVPQQRAYISDPSTYPTVAPVDPLTVAWGDGGTYWHLYNTAAEQVDRRLVPQQRRYVSDPALLASALLENVLLGSADDLRRHAVTAAYGDRRQMPQQRRYDDPTLLGSALLENELLGAVDDLRRRYSVAAELVDRRLVPAQRTFYDTSLLASALLENELLGGADDRTRHAAWFTSRPAVQQPARFDAANLTPPVPADPLLLAGADAWRRNQMAAHTWRPRARGQQQVPLGPPAIAVLRDLILRFGPPTTGWTLQSGQQRWRPDLTTGRWTIGGPSC